MMDWNMKKFQGILILKDIVAEEAAFCCHRCTDFIAMKEFERFIVWLVLKKSMFNKLKSVNLWLSSKNPISKIYCSRIFLYYLRK